MIQFVALLALLPLLVVWTFFCCAACCYRKSNNSPTHSGMSQIIIDRPHIPTITYTTWKSTPQSSNNNETIGDSTSESRTPISGFTIYNSVCVICLEEFEINERL